MGCSCCMWGGDDGVTCGDGVQVLASRGGGGGVLGVAVVCGWGVFAVS